MNIARNRSELLQHYESADSWRVSGQLTPPTEGQVTYEKEQSRNATDYDDIDSKQEDIY